MIGDQRVRVLCAGNLVADLFVPPLAAMPAAGQLCVTEDFLPSTGGCAANVAVGLTRLGVPAAVSGLVGSDIFGDFIRGDLQSKGLAVDGIRRSAQHGTSKTVILPVSGEDRRYIHTFGCNLEFAAADVDLSLLGSGDVLYIGGFLAMPGLVGSEVGALFAEARRRGIQTVLDVVVPAGHGAALAPQLTSVLPHVDWFLPNEEEAEALLGIPDPPSQAGALLNYGCRNVVITRGGEGLYFADAETRRSFLAFAVEVVDGSGAGDALTAGLVLGLLEGWKSEEALTFASAVGALCCTKLGCSAGIPSRDEVEAFARTASVRRPANPAPPQAVRDVDSPDVPAPIFSDAFDG